MLRLAMKPPVASVFSSPAIDPELTSSCIEVMRVQEETTYRCDNFLRCCFPIGHQQDQQSLTETCRKNSAITSGQHDCSKLVDEKCWEKMSEWCYQVVDFCNLSRETVAIAMSYLDRYLLSESGKPVLENKKLFQLVTVTALYVAIKVFDSQSMEPEIMEGLSRGAYTAAQIVDMEMHILTALEWHVQPPTALSFIHNFLSLLPEEAANKLVRRSIFDHARFQTELAVIDFFFITANPSTVAFASIINAIERIDYSFLSASARCSFMFRMAKVAHISMVSNKTRTVQERLSYISRQCNTFPELSPCSSAPLSPIKSSSKSWGVESPRCVASTSVAE